MGPKKYHFMSMRRVLCHQEVTVKNLYEQPFTEAVSLVAGVPWDSLVAQLVKHLPTMWETWVRSLGQEDPLEMEIATLSSTPAWKIPWMEETGRLQSMGSLRVRHD